MLNNQLKLPNALPKGYKLEKYHLIQILAEDNMSLTYLASTTQQEMVTIVEYLPKHLAVRDRKNNHVILKGPNCKYDYEWGLTQYRHEISELIHVKHMGVNTIKTYINANNTLYKVCDYIDGSTLKNYVKTQNKKLTEKELIRLLKSLLAGLDAIHQAGYLHGDLNPSNIIIDNNTQQPVISHLAEPKNLFLGHKNNPQPSPTNYTAYEQHHDTEKQGVWTDIYAVAAIIYELIVGVAPTPSMVRINTNDPMTPIRFLAQNNYSLPFLTAIDRALQIPETQRPQNIDVWKEELGILNQTSPKDSIKNPQTEQENKTSSIKKELSIIGLPSASDDKASFIDFEAIEKPLPREKQQRRNAYKKFMMIILLITLMAGIALYYTPLNNLDIKNTLTSLFTQQKN